MPKADLFLLKWASAHEVQPGGLLTYTIAVGNAGRVDAANVVVIDTLPAGMTYVKDTKNCRQDSLGGLTCDLGDIPTGGTVTFDIIVRVDGSTTGSISNVATVISDTLDRDVTDQVAIVATVLREVVGPGPSPTPVPPPPTPGVVGPPAAGTKPSGPPGGGPWWLCLAAAGLLALAGLAAVTSIVGGGRR
jgi:uncharacterized repeat protein (TIGR01451 family)